MKIFLNGAFGKMGQAIRDSLSPEEEIVVARGKNGILGKAESNTNLPEIEENNDSKVNEVDVGIDFSTPLGTEAMLQYAVKYSFPLVIGTTGLSSEQMEKMKNAAREIKIVYASNFSLGINLLYLLARLSATFLPSNYQIEILEKHHKHKKDAPSGTAKEMAKIIQKVRNISNVKYGRFGSCAERSDDELGIHSLRCGEVFGEHEILFSGDTEEIAIKHGAFSRESFAQGALLAARWVLQHPTPPGIFSMQDVLDMRNILGVES